jgi:uncharacterized protein (TIGR02246 family)
VNAQSPIEEMLDAYKAAVYAKDVDAFVSLYDDDVRVFDLWGRWSHEGSDAWRSAATEWFSSLGSERVRVDFDEVRTIAGDDVAVAHALITFTGLSADGEELRAMTNRLTWALRRTSDANWKVVHEHSSAPAELETGRVMLQR